MKLSDEEKREFKESAESSGLREDMALVCKNRHNPFQTDSGIDLDRYLDRYIVFLTEFNSFMNHAQKPFHKIIDNYMQL